jgi:hypothetical protein
MGKLIPSASSEKEGTLTALGVARKQMPPRPPQTPGTARLLVVAMPTSREAAASLATSTRSLFRSTDMRSSRCQAPTSPWP